MSVESRAKLDRWRCRSLSRSAVSGDGKLLVGELKSGCATVNRIQALLLGGFKSWDVERSGYRRGWVVPLDSDEFQGEMSRLSSGRSEVELGLSAGPRPAPMHALVRSAVSTHREALKASIELREELVAFLDGLPPSKRLKGVRDAVPAFPRPGLTALDLSRAPEAYIAHVDRELVELFGVPLSDSAGLRVVADQAVAIEADLKKKREELAQVSASAAPTLPMLS